MRDSIQCNPEFIITGAIRGSSRETLNQKKALNTYSNNDGTGKIKIKKQSPKYLLNLIPTT